MYPNIFYLVTFEKFLNFLHLLLNRYKIIDLTLIDTRISIFHLLFVRIFSISQVIHTFLISCVQKDDSNRFTDQERVADL